MSTIIQLLSFLSVIVIDGVNAYSLLPHERRRLTEAEARLSREVFELESLVAESRRLDAELALFRAPLPRLAGSEALGPSPASPTPRPATPPPAAYYTLPFPGNPRAVLRVPKGFYSVEEDVTDYEGSLGLGNFSNPISFLFNPLRTNLGSSRKKKKFNGFHLPLPFGLKPISFQLREEEENREGTRFGTGTTTLPPRIPLLRRFRDSLARKRKARVRQNDSTGATGLGLAEALVSEMERRGGARLGGEVEREEEVKESKSVSLSLPGLSSLSPFLHLIQSVLPS